MPNNRSISATQRVKSNPFATRFVAPGRLPWLASGGTSLDVLIDKFCTQHHWRGAIVGPHGSGKSTLLAQLLPHLDIQTCQEPAYRDELVIPKSPVGQFCHSRKRQLVRLQLRGRRQSRRLIWQHLHQWRQPNTLLVLDGYEQLDGAMRLALLILSHTLRAGLLVTSHHRTLLPTLIKVNVDVPLVQSLIDHLLPLDTPERQAWLEPHRLAQRLAHHRGNLRELFMELYDDYDLMAAASSGSERSAISYY